MGGLFGSTTTQTTKSETNTGPSQFQRPFLDDLFGAARDSFSNNRGSAYFDGETFRGMSEDQLADNAAGRNFALGFGNNNARGLIDTGSRAMGGFDSSSNVLNRLAGMAGNDATEEIARNAGRFINNDVLNGQIDAASRDVVRNLTENQLPAIDTAAIGTRGINNSRAGIATGIALRGAQDRIADTAASMRGAAWNQALDQSANEFNNRFTQLGSLSDRFSGLGRDGVNTMGMGFGMGMDAFGAAEDAGRRVQDDINTGLQDEERMWQNRDMRDFDLMKRYQDIVGSQQWGMSGTENSTVRTRQNQGIGSAIAGLAMGGLGMAGTLGWSPFGRR